MHNVFVSLLAVLFAAPTIHPAPAIAQMLLKDVERSKAQQVSDYNYSFLQSELYFSTQSRIVQADESLLNAEEDVTLQLFPDVDPLTIRHVSVEKKPGGLFWMGQVEQDGKVPLPTFMISLLYWDTDPDGNASLSMMNRFKHSPHWDIDEAGKPELRKLDLEAGAVAIAGPPPESSEDIAHHRRMKSLNRHAFYSVQAVIHAVDPQTERTRLFVLQPLKLTPKYSVLYEVDPQAPQVLIDLLPGGKDPRPERDQQLARDFATFVQTLPSDDGRPVKEDLE